MPRDVRSVASGSSRSAPTLLHVGAWGPTHWILLVAAALLLASYLHLLSWGQVDAAIHYLAEHPDVQGAYSDPTAGRLAAFFVVFAFLLLTPPSLLVGLFALLFGAGIAASILAAILRPIGVPGAGARAVVVLGLGASAWITWPRWGPWTIKALGLVARAYLVLTE